MRNIDEFRYPRGPWFYDISEGSNDDNDPNDDDDKDEDDDNNNEVRSEDNHTYLLGIKCHIENSLNNKKVYQEGKKVQERDHS